MDVIAGAAVVGLHHAVEGFIRNGEEGVAAEHGLEHGVVLFFAVGDKVGVFLYGLEALLLAVPVGDLVAKARADAKLLGRLGNLKERAGNLAVGGVVVEDGGDALLDAVDVEGVGRGLGALQGEFAVNGPPGAVQDFIEVGGVVAHDAQAPGQGGIDVGMGVDEGRHNDAALGVDALGVGIFGKQRSFLAHLDDFRALEGHGALLKIGLQRIAGNETAIV